MNNEAIKKIADTYGYDAQSRQLIEEMAELTVALNKYHRGLEDFRKSLNPPPPKKALPLKQLENLIEEIADVNIMLEQIKYLLSISDTDIEHIIEQKLNRQLERIGADES